MDNSISSSGAATPAIAPAPAPVAAENPLAAPVETPPPDFRKIFTAPSALDTIDSLPNSAAQIRANIHLFNEDDIATVQNQRLFASLLPLDQVPTKEQFTHLWDRYRPALAKHYGHPDPERATDGEVFKAVGKFYADGDVANEKAKAIATVLRSALFSGKTTDDSTPDVDAALKGLADVPEAHRDRVAQAMLDYVHNTLQPAVDKLEPFAQGIFEEMLKKKNGEDFSAAHLKEISEAVLSLEKEEMDIVLALVAKKASLSGIKPDPSFFPNLAKAAKHGVKEGVASFENFGTAGYNIILDKVNVRAQSDPASLMTPVGKPFDPASFISHSPEADIALKTSLGSSGMGSFDAWAMFSGGDAPKMRPLTDEEKAQLLGYIAHERKRSTLAKGLASLETAAFDPLRDNGLFDEMAFGSAKIGTQMAPGLAAMFVPGGQPVGLGYFGAQLGAEAYSLGEDFGLSPEMAQLAAVGTMPLTLGVEFVQSLQLLGRAGGFLGRLGRFGAMLERGSTAIERVGVKAGGAVAYVPMRVAGKLAGASAEQFVETGGRWVGKAAGKAVGIHLTETAEEWLQGVIELGGVAVASWLSGEGDAHWANRTDETGEIVKAGAEETVLPWSRSNRDMFLSMVMLSAFGGGMGVLHGAKRARFEYAVGILNAKALGYTEADIETVTKAAHKYAESVHTLEDAKRRARGVIDDGGTLGSLAGEVLKAGRAQAAAQKALIEAMADGRKNPLRDPLSAEAQEAERESARQLDAMLARDAAAEKKRAQTEIVALGAGKGFHVVSGEEEAVADGGKVSRQRAIVAGADGSLKTLEQARAAKALLDTAAKQKQRDAADAAKNVRAANRLNAKRNTSLHGEESVWEQQFIDEMNGRTDAQNDARYAAILRERGITGRVYSVDLAREMFGAFAAEGSRGAVSEATTAAAEAYVADALERELARKVEASGISDEASGAEATPPAPAAALPSIRIVAGGEASGKGTVAAPAAVGEVVFVLPLADGAQAQGWVEKALAAGRSIAIDYVHAPVEMAAARAQGRTRAAGRTVSAARMASSHAGAQDTVVGLLEKYADDERVQIRVMDNSGPVEAVSVVGGEAVTGAERNKAALEFLNSAEVRYDGVGSAAARAREVRTKKEELRTESQPETEPTDTTDTSDTTETTPEPTAPTKPAESKPAEKKPEAPTVPTPTDGGAVITKDAKTGDYSVSSPDGKLLYAGVDEGAAKAAKERFDKQRAVSADPLSPVTTQFRAVMQPKAADSALLKAAEKALHTSFGGNFRLRLFAPPSGVAGDFVKKLESIFGRRILFVGGATVGGALPFRSNGWVHTGADGSSTIFVNVLSESPIHAILGHELGHTFKKQFPKEWRELSKVILKVAPVTEAYRKERLAAGVPEAELVDEWVSDVLGERFAEASFWKSLQVAERAKSKGTGGVVRRAARAVVQWLTRLWHRVRGDEPTLADLARLGERMVAEGGGATLADAALRENLSLHDAQFEAMVEGIVASVMKYADAASVDKKANAAAGGEAVEHSRPAGRSTALPRVWNALANIDRDIFRYPLSAGIGIADVVRDYNTDADKRGVTIELRQGREDASHVDESDMTLLAKDAAGKELARAHVHDVATDTPWLNILRADRNGNGSLLLMAIYDWAHNNDKTMSPDPHGATPIGAMRRTSVMASSALRWMTTRHLSPDRDQHLDWRYPRAQESRAEEQEREAGNIAALLEREAALVFADKDVLAAQYEDEEQEEDPDVGGLPVFRRRLTGWDAGRLAEAQAFVDSVADIYFDFEDGQFKRGAKSDRGGEKGASPDVPDAAVGDKSDAGRVLSAKALAELVASESGSGRHTRKSGVGVGTLERAIITRSILSLPDVGESLAGLASRIGTDYYQRGARVLEGILYSRPQASAVSLEGDSAAQAEWDAGAANRAALASALEDVTARPLYYGSALEQSPAVFGARLGAALHEQGSVSSIVRELAGGTKNAAQLVGLKIHSPRDLAAALGWLRDPLQERMGVAVLNAQYKVIASEILTVGVLQAVPISSPLIAGAIARAGASAKFYAIFHNHPGGDPSPSRADFAETRKLEEAKMPNGAQFLDHIITNGETYFSFIGNGMALRKAKSYEAQAAPLTADALVKPDWEDVKRAHLFPVAGPEESFLDAVRASNPDSTLIFYLNSTKKLTAAEVRERTSDMDALAAHIAGRSGNEGATGVIVDSPVFTDATAGLVALRHLSQALEANGVSLVDVMLSRKDYRQSAFSLGLLSEGEVTDGGTIQHSLPPVSAEELAAMDVDKRETLGRSRHTHPDTLRLLARDTSVDVRRVVAFHEDVPADALLSLAADDDAYVQEYVAGHKITPAAGLAILAKSELSGVRREVASHANTPPAVLAALVADSDVHVLSEVAGNKNTPPAGLNALVAQAEFWRDDALASSYLASSLAPNPALPPEAMLRLARLDGEHEESLLNNSRVTPEALDVLAHKAHWHFLAKRLVTNPNLSAETIDYLSTRLTSYADKFHALAALAKHPHISTELLVQFAKDANWSIREAAAQNSRLPLAQMERIAYGTDFHAMYGLAKNSAAPRDITHALATHALAPGVFEELAKRWGLLPATYERIASRRHHEATLSLAGNYAVPPALLDKLARNGSTDVRVRVAQNFYTSPETLLRLAKSTVPEIREAAFKNKALPQSAIDSRLRQLQRDPTANAEELSELMNMGRVHVDSIKDASVKGVLRWRRELGRVLSQTTDADTDLAKTAKRLGIPKDAIATLVGRTLGADAKAAWLARNRFDRPALQAAADVTQYYMLGPLQRGGTQSIDGEDSAISFFMPVLNDEHAEATQAFGKVQVASGHPAGFGFVLEREFADADGERAAIITEVQSDTMSVVFDHGKASHAERLFGEKLPAVREALRPHIKTWPKALLRNAIRRLFDTGVKRVYAITPRSLRDDLGALPPESVVDAVFGAAEARAEGFGDKVELKIGRASIEAWGAIERDSAAAAEIMYSRPAARGQEAEDAAEIAAQIETVRKLYAGTPQWMKAPNGKPTNLDERQWLHVRTPNFIRWFGDWLSDPANASKILDENGEPLVVYHSGTFDPRDDVPIGAMHFGTLAAALGRAVGKQTDDLIESIEVTPDDDGAWGFSYDGVESEQTYATEIEARSAAITQIHWETALSDTPDDEGTIYTAAFLNIRNPMKTYDRGTQWGGTIEDAQFAGNDGIQYTNRYEDRDSTSYVVFDKRAAVKSATDNTGAYSPTDERLYHSRPQTQLEPSENRLGIALNPLLPPELFEAQRQFALEMNGRTDAENDALYGAILKKHGVVGEYLSSDYAREMFAPYGASKEGAARWQRATQGVTSRYIADLFKRKLASSDIKFVAFLGGGPASGKTSARVEASDNTLVMDSMLTDYAMTVANITKAVAAGKVVDVYYVWNPVEKAVVREWERRQREGRSGSVQLLGRTHFDAQQTAISLLEDLAKGVFPTVNFHAIDNSGARDEQHYAGFSKETDMTSVSRDEKHRVALDFLRSASIRYKDADDTFRRATQAAASIGGYDEWGKGKRGIGADVLRSSATDSSGRGRSGGEEAGAGKSGVESDVQHSRPAADPTRTDNSELARPLAAVPQTYSQAHSPEEAVADQDYLLGEPIFTGTSTDAPAGDLKALKAWMRERWTAPVSRDGLGEIALDGKVIKLLANAGLNDGQVAALVFMPELLSKGRLLHKTRDAVNRSVFYYYIGAPALVDNVRTFVVAVARETATNDASPFGRRLFLHDVFTQKNLQDVSTIPPTPDGAPAGHLEDLSSFVADLFSVNPDSVVNLSVARPLRPAIPNLGEARLRRAAAAAQSAEQALPALFEAFAAPAGSRETGWYVTKFRSWYNRVELADGREVVLSVRDHPEMKSGRAKPDNTVLISRQWTPAEVNAALTAQEDWLAAGAPFDVQHSRPTTADADDVHNWADSDRAGFLDTMSYFGALAETFAALRDMPAGGRDAGVTVYRVSPDGSGHYETDLKRGRYVTLSRSYADEVAKARNAQALDFDAWPRDMRTELRRRALEDGPAVEVLEHVVPLGSLFWDGRAPVMLQYDNSFNPDHAKLQKHLRLADWEAFREGDPQDLAIQHSRPMSGAGAAGADDWQSDRRDADELLHSRPPVDAADDEEKWLASQRPDVAARLRAGRALADVTAAAKRLKAAPDDKAAAADYAAKKAELRLRQDAAKGAQKKYEAQLERDAKRQTARLRSLLPRSGSGHESAMWFRENFLDDAARLNDFVGRWESATGLERDADNPFDYLGATRLSADGIVNFMALSGMVNPSGDMTGAAPLSGAWDGLSTAERERFDEYLELSAILGDYLSGKKRSEVLNRGEDAGDADVPFPAPSAAEDRVPAKPTAVPKADWDAWFAAKPKPASQVEWDAWKNSMRLGHRIPRPYKPTKAEWDAWYAKKPVSEGKDVWDAWYAAVTSARAKRTAAKAEREAALVEAGRRVGKIYDDASLSREAKEKTAMQIWGEYLSKHGFTHREITASRFRQLASEDFLRRARIVAEWQQGLLDYAKLGSPVLGAFVDDVAAQVDVPLGADIPLVNEDADATDADDTGVVVSVLPMWEWKFAGEAEERKKEAIKEQLRGSRAAIHAPLSILRTQVLHIVKNAVLRNLYEQSPANAKVPKERADEIIASIRDTVERMVNVGMVDFETGEYTGVPALVASFRGLSPDETQRFHSYLHARRTAKLAGDGRGRGSGMELAEAEAILAEEADNVDFQLRAKDIYAWSEGLLDFAAAASPRFLGKQVQDIRKKDPGDYVPLQRVKGAEDGNHGVYVDGEYETDFGAAKGERQGVDEVAAMMAEFQAEDAQAAAGEAAFKPTGLQGLDYLVPDGRLAERMVQRDLAANMLRVAQTFVKRTQKSSVIARILAMANDPMAGGALKESVSPVAANDPLLLRSAVDEEIGLDALAAARGLAEKFMPGRGGEAAVLAFFAPEVEAVDGSGYFVAQADGGAVAWYFIERGLYEAVQSLDAHVGRLKNSTLAKWLRDFADGAAPMDWAINAADFGVGSLQFMARMFRLGATVWNPKFGLGTNVMRDFKTLTYNTAGGANPLKVWKNWLGFMAHMAVRGATGGHVSLLGEGFERYEQMFGGLGMGLSGSLTQSSHPFEVAVRRVRGEVTAKRILFDGYEILMNILQFPENAARMAELKTVLEGAGWNPSMKLTPELAVRAALAGKRVTVDFTRAGKFARQWNTVVPFLNSSIQGKLSAWEAFKRDPMRWLFTRGLMVSLLAAANWLRNKDEPWYRELSARQRGAYDFVRLGDEVLQIPRAFEVDLLFAGMTEAILDGVNAKEPERIWDWFKALAEEFSVAGSLDTGINHDMLPPIIREALAQVANNDAYWQSPIVGHSDELRAPAEQYGPYTSNVAIRIGGALGVSPKRIDHALRGFMAGSGAFAIGLGGTGGGLENPKARREDEVADALFGFGGAYFRRGGVNIVGGKSVDALFARMSAEWARADKLGGISKLTPQERQAALALTDAWSAVAAIAYIHDREPSRDARGKLAQLRTDIAKEALADFKGATAPANPVKYRGLKSEWQRKAGPDYLQQIEAQRKANRSRENREK